MPSRPLEWWYWLAGAMAGAIALTAWQALYLAWRSGVPTSFPVQVRLAYLGLFIAGLWPPLVVLHWIQLCGTTVMVLADYCLLARCLSLLPWNRHVPLTWRRVLRTFLSRPVKGNILQGLSSW